MGIYYQSTVIGDVRAQRISAAPGIGCAQLRVTLEWTIHPKQVQDYSIFGTYVRVYATAEGSSEYLHLGHAFPEVAWSEQAREGISLPRQVVYHLTLLADQLLALEHLRQNLGLLFKLEVRGQSFGALGVHSVDQTLQVAVSLGDWLQALTESRLADVLLIGLPLPIEGASSVATPLALVRRAHRFLQNGQYDACIAECRRAIESLWKIAQVREASTKARAALAEGNQRRAMTKEARTLAVGEAIMNFTQPAHHVGNEGDPEVFSRLDATLSLATTAALIGTLSASMPMPTIGGSGS